MILDKISQFSEGKYAIDVPADQIVTDYEDKRGDAAAVIEALSINQRFISTCKPPACQPMKPC
jgi:amphiphysin